MKQFNVLSDEEMERKYNCTRTRNSSHFALVQSIMRDTIKDTLRQVAEILDGIENPHIRDFTREFDRNVGFDEAIQTIKQAIEEG